MTATKRRLTVADLAPGWRFKHRGHHGLRVHIVDRVEGDRITAHADGYASWRFVNVTDIIVSTIAPPARREAD